jgi:hypothetical protein
MSGLPADAATEDAAVRWLLSCSAATALPRLLEACGSHGQAGSAMVDRDLPSLLHRHLLGDYTGPALHG